MNEETMVASIPEEQLVDDTQAAEVISAEDLAASVMSGEETVEEESGDDSQQPEEKPRASKGEDRSSQIRAALKSQKEQIYRDLGMSEAEVRELIREHKAQEMAKSDPDISVKAAKEILKAREGTRADRTEEINADIETLRQDGWTDDELQELATDKTVINNMRNGMTLRQAARAYEKAARQQSTTRKRAVPTVRGATGSGSGDSMADMIDSMTDSQFKAFRERVHKMRMEGKAVKL
jgi:hypothetical protein